MARADTTVDEVISSIPDINRGDLNNINGFVEDFEESTIKVEHFEAHSTSGKNLIKKYKDFILRCEYHSEDFLREAESTTFAIETKSAQFDSRGEANSTDVDSLQHLIDKVSGPAKDISAQITDDYAVFVAEARSTKSSTDKNHAILTKIRKILLFECDKKIFKVRMVTDDLVIKADRLKNRAKAMPRGGTNMSSQAQAQDSTPRAIFTMPELKVSRLRFPSPPEVFNVWKQDVLHHFDGASSAYSFGQILKQLCTVVEDDWKTFIHNTLDSPSFTKPKILTTVMEAMDKEAQGCRDNQEEARGGHGVLVH